MMKGNYHLLFEDPMGSMFTAVHVFSDSVFCTGQDALGASSASEIWTKKAESSAKKSNSCKNISDIAGQSIEIDWHACFGDTSVQMLQKLKAVMSEAAHEPEHFFGQDHFREHVQRHHQLGKSKSASYKCPVQGKEEAIHAARFQPSDWCFCGVVQDQNGPGHTPKHDRLNNVLMEDGTVSRFG